MVTYHPLKPKLKKLTHFGHAGAFEWSLIVPTMYIPSLSGDEASRTPIPQTAHFDAFSGIFDWAEDDFAILDPHKVSLN